MTERFLYVATSWVEILKNLVGKKMSDTSEGDGNPNLDRISQVLSGWPSHLQQIATRCSKLCGENILVSQNVVAEPPRLPPNKRQKFL